MKKALLGAIVSFSLFLTACGGSSKGYSFKAGTYEGSGTGKNGSIKVSVEVSNDSIKKVDILEQNETPSIAKDALEKIPQNIVKEQSLAIDTISGATITSQGILDAVKDALSSSGVDMNKLTQKTASTNNQVEEVEADIVVIGAGGAGTAAALRAAQEGKKVMLLEKTATPMGASTLAGGMFAADSRLQQEQGKTVDKSWLYEQYYKASNGYMNSLLVDHIIDEAGNTVNWLLDNHMELNLVDAGSGAAYNHVGMPATLHGYNEGGSVALKKFVQEFENAGGEVRWLTPAYEIQKDDNGVKAVLAKKEDGSTLKINTKAAIIATGGYGGNKEMLEKYIGDQYTMGEVAQNTGDGINMAYSLGAGRSGLGVTQYFWETFKPEEIGQMAQILGNDWFSMTAFTMFPFLRVNALGQRYSDETKVTSFSEHGGEIAQQPGQYEYAIIDSSILKKIAQSGVAVIEDQYASWVGNEQFYMEFNEPNSTDAMYAQQHTPIDFTTTLDKLLDTKVVYKGNTIDELAKSMDVDADTLQASVNQYNQAIVTGHDDAYAANTNRLVEVKEGPYYAVKYVARNLGTLGGISINENMQVLDKDFNVIKGLYAAGADAGGMYGKAYVDFEGGTLGFAYTSGRLAGERAAKDIK
ncbi:FAD-dependent oxidoreductase [Solobacterium moorei]|uniref:Urocanate reductase n=1 Tax=Solobacterium moorei TaxID=102148 RepID=A0A412PFD5_9FIRM|nr:FAD-dependent oxidoreductase [Solobacterium moorei]RGT56345.1 FAD-dependent oxidoreductase [Solobacterium moorei]